MPTPDTYHPFTTTFPARLLALIDARAALLGLTRAAYLVGLSRADLAAAGVRLPAPPPPKKNGPAKKSAPTT